MLYEIILRAAYAGQELLNRFNYVSDDAVISGTPSAELVKAFGTPPVGTPPLFTAGTIMGTLQTLQSAGVQYLSLAARAIWDDADFFEAGFVTAVLGAVTGDGESPVASFGFETTRVLQSIRRGHKRFGGVPKTALANKGEIATGVMTDLDALAVLLGSTLSSTVGAVTIHFTPCVVSKQKHTDTTTGKVTYRYYPTLAEQLDHIAVAPVWSVQTDVRTQNSRQYGRGV